MKILQVTDIDSGTITHVGMLQERSDCAEILEQLIYEEDLYRHVEIEVYDGELPSDRDDEEIARAHELGQLLSLRMGWA